MGERKVVKKQMGSNGIVFNRKFWINLHLVLASLFLPFLLLMPLTGGLYLLRFPGEQVKTAAFSVSASIPSEEKAMEAFFREEFQKQGIEYDFEYIRKSGSNYIFRPTTRTHYTASEESGLIAFTRVEPDLLKRMIELHKGHGPRVMRTVEIAFGVSLILVTLSGIWLALNVPTYRRTMLISFGIGTVIIALAMLG
jgi:hypothetical protein